MSINKRRFSDVVDGECFRQGKRPARKKIGGHSAVSVTPKGRVNTRKVKGDPKVDVVGCPLRLLGVGLRNHPDTVVEIGDGNILKRRRRR